MKECGALSLFLCIQCALQFSWVAVAYTTMQQSCSSKQPGHPLRGRLFKGFFINSDEHFSARLAPSVYGCRAACKQAEHCIVLSFNESNEATDNCKLFNSTRFHWNLEKDNSSTVILLTPPGCNEATTVDGGWSEWVNVSACLSFGASHLVKQERYCDSPSPACNGRLCAGPARHEVTCIVTTGLWTMIQRRFDGSVDFYRGWQEYKNGFGDPGGEFWLGLAAIHNLTKSGDWTLRFDVWDDTEHRFAEYENATVADEADNYRLDYASYTGTAGDAMHRSKGRSFSTYDQDNDQWSYNCAEAFKGAWWYVDCHSSNLNGLYLNGNNTQRATGMTWNQFRGQYYSLLRTEIKIQRM